MSDIVDRLANWNTVYEEDADCDGSLYLAARDEILRLREEWQPIETAPMDGTEIIGWAGDVVILSYRYDENDREEKRGKMWLDNSYDDFSCGLASVPYEPTHWRPLPDPPQK